MDAGYGCFPVVVHSRPNLRCEGMRRAGYASRAEFAHPPCARYVSLMRIGLISDTHLPSLIHRLDELGPEIGEFLATVELILHGGDVTAPAVLDWCAQFAPVLVSRGNNDRFQDPRMADVQLLEVEGWRIGMARRPSLPGRR